MRGAHRGFTIIELMVVLSVAGIVLVYGVPSYNSFVKNGRLSGGVNQLVTAMHLSRSEASKRGVPVVLCTSTSALNAGNESCETSATWSDGWIAFADTDDNGAYNTATDVLVQSQGDQGKRLSISASDEISQLITYLPNGFARLPLNATSGRYIVYCLDDEDDEFSRVLSFSNSGRPQVVDRNNVNDAPSCAVSGS